MIPGTPEKPLWATSLPSRADLQYTQQLLTVLGLVLVATWLVFTVVRDPSAALRIGRKQLGA